MVSVPTRLALEHGGVRANDRKRIIDLLGSKLQHFFEGTYLIRATFQKDGQRQSDQGSNEEAQEEVHGRGTFRSMYQRSVLLRVSRFSMFISRYQVVFGRLFRSIEWMTVS